MLNLDFAKAKPSAVPYVLDEKCLACRKCVARASCRSKAILQIDPGEPPFIDGNLCYGCHVCVPACPSGAIVVQGV